MLDALTPKQNRFIPLYLSGKYTGAQLAQLLDVDVNTVYNWKRNENIKRVIEYEQESIYETSKNDLKSMSEQAIHTMRELMSSPIDGIRYQAAKDVLDRNGFKAENKIKIDKTVTSIEQRISTLIEQTMGDVIEVIDYKED